MPNTAKLAFALLFVLIFLIIPDSPSARTWVVNVDGTGDAPTIQAAADSSAQGDTVLVAPGIYFENIYLEDKGIVLSSESGPEVTTLDGSEGPSATIYFIGAEDAVIEGFSIRNRNGEYAVGIAIDGGRPIIRNNILRENESRGIHCEGNGIIESNLFVDNGSEYQRGGAIHIAYFGHDDTPSVRGNIFRNNQGREGAAIYMSIDEGIIENNLFVFNEAVDGSVICCDSAHLIAGNTLYGNRADAGTIAFINVTSPNVENNIIANTLGGCGVFCVPLGGYTPTPNFYCNTLWNNEGGAWAGEGCEILWWPGNFEGDPLLCDPENGDFHLAENSPCAPGNHPDGHPCGLIGTFEAGCIPVPVAHPTTWGALKAMYGSGK